MSKRKASLGLHALKEKTEELSVESEKALKEEKTEDLPKSKKKQPIPIYVDPLLHDALHMLVFSERHKKTTFQSLFMEALDLLLERRGLPTVKELSNGERTINL